jgi:predicted membrane channel-forming protein YqfA (hemolysin III family)
LSEYRSAWTGEANFTRRLGEAISGLPYAWTTFWARFNYGQIVLPDIVYQIINLLCALAVVGWIRRIIISLQRRFNVIPSPDPKGTQSERARNLSDNPIDSSSQRTLLGMTDSQNIAGLVIVILSIILSLSGWGALMITIPATANARLVFQIFPALGALLVLGWSELFKRKAREENKNNFSAPLALSAVNFLFALYALIFYLAPAYAYPATITSLPADAKSVLANFEGAAEIIGYRISNDSVQAGDLVDVTIYWRPLAPTASPFPAFVHLVDRQRIIAAQRDTYHGLGAAPSHQWRVGVTFADVYRVYIPETAYTPETLTVRVGMWNTVENRPLITRDNDALEIGTIQLTPKPLAINFANRVTLVGYDAERRVLKPGDTLTLITRWRATNPGKEYWWYAHLVGLDRKIWKIANGPFTPQLTLDELRSETRDILLPNDLPNGQYFVEVGVTSDGQRKIGILASDGRQVGDYVDVMRVRVEK